MVAKSNVQFEHQVHYGDSGANAHITSDKQNLTQQMPFNEGETDTVGNGTGLLIKSIGSTSLQIGKTKFCLSKSYAIHMPLLIFSPLINFV